MSNEREEQAFKTNYRTRNSQPNTPRQAYEKVLGEFRSLLASKTHPDNRTPAEKQIIIDVLNRLCVAADDLDSSPETNGQGIFGLIILSLSSALSLKDRNIELEYKIKELEQKIKKLEKRSP